MRTFTRCELIHILQVSEEFLRSLEDEDIVRFTEAGCCSELDMERARLAFWLVNEVGVNLPGVDMVLHMRETMIEMEDQFCAVLREIARRRQAREQG